MRRALLPVVTATGGSAILVSRVSAASLPRQNIPLSKLGRSIVHCALLVRPRKLPRDSHTPRPLPTNTRHKDLRSLSLPTYDPGREHRP